MIKPPLNLKPLPAWLFALEIVPTYLVYGLFWLIESSWHDVELVVYDCCVILTRLYVLPACLNDPPVIFCSWIGRTVGVKAAILKLLFVFRNSSEENNFFLIDGKSMSVPRCWIIGWIGPDLAPFPFRVLIEVLFYSIVKWARAGDPSVYVDCIVVFAIGHVISWATWRIVYVGWQNSGRDLLIDRCIVPRFRALWDVDFAMLENFVGYNILFQLYLLLVWTKAPLLGLLCTSYVLVLFNLSVKLLHHGLVGGHFCPQCLQMVYLLFFIMLHSSINTF